MRRAIGAPAVGAALCALTTSAAGQGSCDRGCLQGIISAGKIHEIEAMGFVLPLYSKNGWSQFTR
jgi:hypothetical protein